MPAEGTTEGDLKMVDVAWVNDKFSAMVRDDLICLDQPYSQVIAPPTAYVPPVKKQKRTEKQHSFLR